jgi:hypothetical protein
LIPGVAITIVQVAWPPDVAAVKADVGRCPCGNGSNV